MTAPSWIALLVAFIATLTDITRGKVYNQLTYGAMLTALVLSIVAKSPSLRQSVIGLLASFLLYFAIHKLTGLGAGDVKLMAGIGALKGFPFVLYATFYILCISSVLGLLLLAWRGRLWPALKWVFATVVSSVIPKFPKTALEGGMTTMPFAPAIFLGIVYCLYLEATGGPLTTSWWDLNAIINIGCS